jgi:hypothetical protein
MLDHICGFSPYSQLGHSSSFHSDSGKQIITSGLLPVSFLKDGVINQNTTQ